MALFEAQQKLDEGNRRVTRRVFVGFVGAGVVGLIGRRFYKRLDKPPAGYKTPFITPPGEFYSITYNGYPDVAPGTWKLTLAGPEGKSVVLTLDELKTLPNKLIYKTFECIENPVGGDTAIGNAEWRVTPLSPLLEKVLPKDFSKHRVVFRAHDDYFTSLPVSEVLDPESYLAYEMNGQPLPRRHGRPARVLLPGKYGYKQPKWIKEIRVTDEEIHGYWEEKGWSKSGEVKAMSRIDTAAFEGMPGDALLTGVAYGGRQAVAKIEVSLDGGETWRAAEISSPTGKNHWSLWRFVWKNAPAGKHKIVVRMTDEAGKLQLAEEAGDYPSGASGWHRVEVSL